MKYIALFASLALLTACGSDQNSTNNVEVEKLKSKKDSLLAVSQGIATEIEEVNALIAKHDSTKKLTKVTGADAQLGTFANYFEVYGNVDSKQNVLVPAETNGEIVSIQVREGNRVNKGAVLMRLDDEVLRQNVKELETQLKLAEDVYQRQKRLWENNVGSEMQYLEAETNVNTLKNRLAGLKKQLDMAVVKAPVSGTVDKIFPKEGEFAAAGMQLVRLINLDEMYIEADIADRYSRVVTDGKRVKVVFPELDITIDTVITRVSKFINPANRTFEALVRIDNQERLIKPNALALLKIESMYVDSAVTVPVRTLQESSTGETFVYVLKKENGYYQVVRKSVVAGPSYAGRILITDGLQGGEILVDKGSRRVRDGQLVEIDQ